MDASGGPEAARPIVLPVRRKISARDVLPAQQARALDIVKEEPGCSIRRVAVRLRITHTTATYHLHALARLGLIVQVREGRQLRHFVGGLELKERDFLAAFLRDGNGAAVLRLLEMGKAGMTIHQMARCLEMPFGTTKRLLEQLRTWDIAILERRHFRYAVQLNPAKRAEVRAVLASASASSAAAATLPAPRA